MSRRAVQGLITRGGARAGFRKASGHRRPKGLASGGKALHVAVRAKKR